MANPIEEIPEEGDNGQGWETFLAGFPIANTQPAPVRTTRAEDPLAQAIEGSLQINQDASQTKPVTTAEPTLKTLNQVKPENTKAKETDPEDDFRDFEWYVVLTGANPYDLPHTRQKLFGVGLNLIDMVKHKVLCSTPFGQSRNKIIADVLAGYCTVLRTELTKAKITQVDIMTALETKDYDFKNKKVLLRHVQAYLASLNDQLLKSLYLHKDADEITVKEVNETRLQIQERKAEVLEIQELIAINMDSIAKLKIDGTEAIHILRDAKITHINQLPIPLTYPQYLALKKVADEYKKSATNAQPKRAKAPEQVPDDKNTKIKPLPSSKLTPESTDQNKPYEQALKLLNTAKQITNMVGRAISDRITVISETPIGENSGNLGKDESVSAKDIANRISVGRYQLISTILGNLPYSLPDSLLDALPDTSTDFDNLSIEQREALDRAYRTHTEDIEMVINGILGDFEINPAQLNDFYEFCGDTELFKSKVRDYITYRFSRTNAKSFGYQDRLEAQKHVAVAYSTFAEQKAKTASVKADAIGASEAEASVGRETVYIKITNELSIPTEGGTRVRDAGAIFWQQLISHSSPYLNDNSESAAFQSDLYELKDRTIDLDLNDSESRAVFALQLAMLLSLFGIQINDVFQKVSSAVKNQEPIETPIFYEDETQEAVQPKSTEEISELEAQQIRLGQGNFLETFLYYISKIHPDRFGLDAKDFLYNTFFLRIGDFTDGQISSLINIFIDSKFNEEHLLEFFAGEIGLMGQDVLDNIIKETRSHAELTLKYRTELYKFCSSEDNITAIRDFIREFLKKHVAIGGGDEAQYANSLQEAKMAVAAYKNVEQKQNEPVEVSSIDILNIRIVHSVLAETYNRNGYKLPGERLVLLQKLDKFLIFSDPKAISTDDLAQINMIMVKMSNVNLDALLKNAPAVKTLVEVYQFAKTPITEMQIFVDISFYLSIGNTPLANQLALEYFDDFLKKQKI